MNRFTLLLIGSLALNIGLITLFAFTRASNPAPQPVDAVVTAASTVSLQSTDADGSAIQLRRRDYPRLLEILLSTELNQAESSRIVRDVALSDWINDAHRIQNATPYWQPPLSALEKLEIQRQLTEERRIRETALTELLGTPESLDPASEVLFLLPADISATKARAVAWLNEDYQTLRTEMNARHTENEPSQIDDSLQMLESEKNLDLALILSSDELAHYQLRATNTAQALREELRFFQPSAAEFESIFQARQQAKTPAEAEQKLQKALDEDRFETLAQTTGPQFQNLAEIATRFAIPPTDILEVHRFTRLIQKQQKEILDDNDLSDEEKMEAIDLLLAEGKAVIARDLGSQAYDAYLEENGSWLEPATSSSTRSAR